MVRTSNFTPLVVVDHQHQHGWTTQVHMSSSLKREPLAEGPIGNDVELVQKALDVLGEPWAGEWVGHMVQTPDHRSYRIFVRVGP